jgi:hypothetical protein
LQQAAAGEPARYTDLGPFEIRADKPLGEQSRDYVRNKGQQTGQEYILAFDASGKVIAHGHGSPDNVKLPPGLEKAILDPSQSVVIHHNHPCQFLLDRDDPASACLYSTVRR